MKEDEVGRTRMRERGLMRMKYYSANRTARNIWKTRPYTKEDNKIDFRELICKDVDWIHFA
jgi:hypothetical protein